MTKKVATPKLPPVLQTADFDKADAISLQAVAGGYADEHQQRRAMEWIIFKACAFNDISYRPDSERDSSFAEGKRFVAQQINALLTHNTRIT